MGYTVCWHKEYDTRSSFCSVLHELCCSVCRDLGWQFDDGYITSITNKCMHAAPTSPAPPRIPSLCAHDVGSHFSGRQSHSFHLPALTCAFTPEGFDENCYGDAGDRLLLSSMDEKSRQELLLERFAARKQMLEYHEVGLVGWLLACIARDLCVCDMYCLCISAEIW